MAKMSLGELRVGKYRVISRGYLLPWINFQNCCKNQRFFVSSCGKIFICCVGGGGGAWLGFVGKLLT